MASAKKKGSPVQTEQGASGQGQQKAKAVQSSSADKNKPAAKEAKQAKPAKSAKAKKGGKPGFLDKVKAYFAGVRQEVRRVVWPTRPELVKYTGSVVGMLIFMGILIYLVDSAVLPLLYSFANLRG